MIDLTINHIAGTASQIIVAGLLAAGLFPAKTGDKINIDSTRPSQTEYTPTCNLFSSGQNFILNLNRETIERDDFEKSVGIFYARLLADQEPLGEEFEAVLHKNLWDLYES